MTFLWFNEKKSVYFKKLRDVHYCSSVCRPRCLSDLLHVQKDQAAAAPQLLTFHTAQIDVFKFVLYGNDYHNIQVCSWSLSFIANALMTPPVVLTFSGADFSWSDARLEYLNGCFHKRQYSRVNVWRIRRSFKDEFHTLVLLGWNLKDSKFSLSLVYLHLYYWLIDRASILKGFQPNLKCGPGQAGKWSNSVTHNSSSVYIVNGLWPNYNRMSAMRRTTYTRADTWVFINYQGNPSRVVGVLS